MELWYDLHIHSCLSPCADEDMTPGNIVNMARLKGLDAISVCDHNTTGNIRSVAKAAGEVGLLFMPGIEVTTAEEVHLLGYFKEVDAACAFGDEVYAALPDIPNAEELFGRQILMNENDEITGTLPKLLLSALPFSFEECAAMIRKYGGEAVPAHISRGANSVLANLGFIPPGVRFKTIEAFAGGQNPALDLSGYNVIHSSDAHNLCDISEKTYTLFVTEPTIYNLFSSISL